MSSTNTPIYQTLCEKHNFQESLQQALLQIMAQTGCQIPAKVEAVQSNGLDQTGTVDLQPLLNLQSADGQSLAQPILYKVPYFRIQGGDSALIIDPKKGDIGQLILCGRDISGLSALSKPEKPASARLWDSNDCFFLPALFCQRPAQYILASETGWQIHAKDKGEILLEADKIMLSGDVLLKGNVTIEGDLTVKGTITAQQDISALQGALSLQNHIHPLVSPSGPTGKPQ